MIAIVCSMLFAHFSLLATSAFCTYGLIKGRLYENTCRLRDLSKWYIQ